MAGGEGLLVRVAMARSFETYWTVQARAVKVVVGEPLVTKLLNTNRGSRRWMKTDGAEMCVKGGWT